MSRKYFEKMKMSKGEINKSMINFITFNKNLSELMVKSFPNLIEELCGKELFVTKKGSYNY